MRCRRRQRRYGRTSPSGVSASATTTGASSTGGKISSTTGGGVVVAGGVTGVALVPVVPDGGLVTVTTTEPVPVLWTPGVTGVDAAAGVTASGAPSSPPVPSPAAEPAASSVSAAPIA